MSNNDGKPSQGAGVGQTNSDDSLNNSASRARNKTVMLTPEMTGKLRGMISKDGLSGDSQTSSPSANGGASDWQSPLSAQSLKPRSRPTSAPNETIPLPSSISSVSASGSAPVSAPPASPKPGMSLNQPPVAPPSGMNLDSAPKPMMPSSSLQSSPPPAQDKPESTPSSSILPPALGGAALGGVAAGVISSGVSLGSAGLNATPLKSAAPANPELPKMDIPSASLESASLESASLESVSDNLKNPLSSVSAPSPLSQVPLASQNIAEAESVSKMLNPAFSSSAPSPIENEVEVKKTADLNNNTEANSVIAENSDINVASSVETKEAIPQVSSSLPPSTNLGGLEGNKLSSCPLGQSSNGLGDASPSSSLLGSSAPSNLNGGINRVEAKEEKELTNEVSLKHSEPKEIIEKEDTEQVTQSVPQKVTSSVNSINPKKLDNKTVGFLLSYDNSENAEVYEISTGRWLLTSRRNEQDDYIFIDHPSISALHAIVRASDDGKIQILDQLSEFGTGVLRDGGEKEEDVSGTMITVETGDVVRFGKRYFVVCLLPDAAIKLASIKE